MAPDIREAPGDNIAPKHEKFDPKTGRQSLYAALKEGFNITIGNMEMDGILAHISGDRPDAKQYGFEILGGLLGGVRQGFFHYLPTGERFGYRGQKEGVPQIIYYYTSTPLSWSYYGAYLTTKQAVMDALNGTQTPTELNPN
jgi:hypothetical protein